MSQAGSEEEAGPSAPRGELNAVVAELRAELQSIREREVRRESRLVAFDQQLANMETSLEREVDRLRTTGSAVDLITEHLRIAVRELLGEREQLAGDMDDLRARITALGAPDLQPVLTQLDQVGNRLAALPGRELRPLADQLEQLQQQLASLPAPDLAPVNEQLEALHTEVASIQRTDLQPVIEALQGFPKPDMGPVVSWLGAIDARLEGLDDLGVERVLDQVAIIRDLISALPATDLSPLVTRIDELRERVTAPPALDLGPVQVRIDALAAQVAAIPSPDLAGLERRLDAVGEVDLEPIAAEIAVLRDLVSSIPPPDLTGVEDRLAALPTVDLAPLERSLEALQQQVAALPTPQPVDLEPVQHRVDAVHRAVTDGLANLPAPADDAELREDLSRLNAQLDGLRTALADRFDAIPAPDLEPVTTELAALSGRIAAIPAPDLGPVARELSGLADRITAIPTPDLSSVTTELAALADRITAIPAPDLSSVEQRLARLDERISSLPTADAVRGDDRTDEVLRALTDATGEVRERIAALPDPGSAGVAAVAPLRTDIEVLVSASAEVRRDLALVTEVLAGLTQLAEKGDARLTGLSEAQLEAANEQRSATTEAVAAVGRALGGQMQQVESQVVQLVARSAALDDIQQNLGRTRDAITGLTTRADRAEEASQQNADQYALALARVTAASDALASTVGAVRAALGTLVEESRDATIGAVDERVGGRLDEASARVEEKLTAHLDAALAELGITQLRRSLADVAAQVVESRADARSINESIVGFDDRVAQTASAAVLPVTTALGRLRQQVEAIPAPDLGPVAAQLARLSATIVSQARDDAATPADLEVLRASVLEALDGIGEQLEAHAAATTKVASQLSTVAANQPDHEQLAKQITEQITEHLGRADTARQAFADLVTQHLDESSSARQAGLDQLTEQLRQADAARHAGLEQVAQHLRDADAATQARLDQLAKELAATREAAERRTGSRWRRGGGDDQALPAATAPSELEQRIEEALRELDQRLSSIAQLVERAGVFADDAAQASAATLRMVSAPPPAAPPRTEPAPVKPPAAKAPAVKKTPLKAAPKKAATKKATAKKATTAKKTAAKKASPAKRSPAKKASPPESPAPPTG